jgi:SAM-dependent methyltransferase
MTTDFVTDLFRPLSAAAGSTYGIGLSNVWRDEDRRLGAAQEIADPATFRHLETIGIAAGMRCLEVGGGRGSVARFMAERVGASGTVVDTDLDITRLEACDRPNIEVRIHDIAADPLPEAEFDIIHARLVLEHLPSRLAVLDRLTAALRPGGWLLIEDFDHSAPTHLSASRQLFVPRSIGPKWRRTMLAARALAPSSGIDLEFARKLPAHLVDAGLDEVDAEVCSPLVRGGTPRADYYRLSLLQVGTRLVATGIVSQRDLDDVIDALGSPGTLVQSTPMVSAWGRRRG